MKSANDNNLNLSTYFRGGKIYGYFSESSFAPRTVPYETLKIAGYFLRINPIEAAVVRRIFEAYGNGKSALRISSELNEELRTTRAPQAPRGPRWSLVSLLGGDTQGRGILHQTLYLGIYTWSGKEITMPELRIIDDELWGKVQERVAFAGVVSGRHFQKGKVLYSKHLLTGILKCSL